MTVLEAFGDAAWRATLPHGTDARSLLAVLRAHPGVVDAVVTEGHALAVFDPEAAQTGRVALAAAIDAALGVGGAHGEPSAAVADAPREHVVRVRYDGADIAEVAAA